MATPETKIALFTKSILLSRFDDFILTKNNNDDSHSSRSMLLSPARVRIILLCTSAA